jgi:hypothetical protein
MSRAQLSKVDQIRDAAEADLVTFIRLIAPHRHLGKVHEDLCRWWTRYDAKSHQLVLLPRDHQKSAMIAYRVAWEITKNPAITVLYISSTSNLAEKQLKFIKDILSSRQYRKYWPEMVNEEEGKRAKWTNTEIEVDHPLRKAEGVRDPTVFTAGLTTSITGFHCNIAVLDDVVVQENAYTNEGRGKVKSQYSLLASIESADAREWVVGTRYHPADLYQSLAEMESELYDQYGQVSSREQVYEVYQREVEDQGDGTGEYLWPRAQRYDGKWFGFNQEILSKKRAQYLDKTQFYAQYYNNPNAAENQSIQKDYFQYYERKYLTKEDGKWFFRDRGLSIVAAIDFAYSLKETADYSAIAVVGTDHEGNHYVLDLARFRTTRISDYWDEIYKLYAKWGFRKMRGEVSVAQEAIVEELKTHYIKQAGIPLSIDKFRPTRSMGTKEERMDAALKARYENGSMWHYQGGMCEELELELVQAKPRHDDLKDALANAVTISIVPKHYRKEREQNVIYHPRFGGVA